MPTALNEYIQPGGQAKETYTLYNDIPFANSRPKSVAENEQIPLVPDAKNK